MQNASTSPTIQRTQTMSINDSLNKEKSNETDDSTKISSPEIEQLDAEMEKYWQQMCNIMAIMVHTLFKREKLVELEEATANEPTQP